jgi:serine/threonine-protein kinase
VSNVTANPSSIYPGGCPAGNTTSAISATVNDPDDADDRISVSFTYSFNGKVFGPFAMSPVGRHVFRGTLSQMPAPRQDTTVAISVSAKDAAGNPAKPGATSVLLYSYCPIG